MLDLQIQKAKCLSDLTDALPLVGEPLLMKFIDFHIAVFFSFFSALKKRVAHSIYTKRDHFSIGRGTLFLY